VLSEVNRKNAGSGKPSLNARIGIETGPVVVDASGEIYGDTELGFFDTFLCTVSAIFARLYLCKGAA
jgi:hypothetical protein